MLEGSNLLSVLKARERALLEPHVSECRFTAGDTICEPGELVRYCYFPRGGALAVFLVLMENGEVVETAMVGREGALGGIVSLARLGAVSPNTGEGLEFEVIAAVVIGGTSLSGGQGKILRTIIGVIIIALTRNFLNLARIEIFWQGFATGTIILAAVLLEALQRRISARG